TSTPPTVRCSHFLARQYPSRCQPTRHRRHLRSQPCSDKTGLELTELRAAVGKNGIDGRHSPPQLVRRAQLIDGIAQNRIRSISRAGKRQHENGEPENI